jgi:hypothetical protein
MSRTNNMFEIHGVEVSNQVNSMDCPQQLVLVDKSLGIGMQLLFLVQVLQCLELLGCPSAFRLS